MKPSIPAHPLSELFPLHDGPPLWDLRKDIEEHGLIDPIVTYQGKILDGRRRHVCCVAAGIDPTYRPFKGTDAQALAFVVSKNLRRRHLGEAERAMVAAKIAKLPLGANQHTAPEEGSAGALPSQSEAAAMLNVSVDAVKRAKTVQDHGSDELKAAVADGTVTLSDAATVAKQPKETQAQAVDAVRNGQARTAAESVGREPGQDDDTMKVRFKQESGKTVFDDRKVGESISKLARLFNERANALGHQKHKGWLEVHKRMNGLLEAWKEWQRG